MLCAIDAFIWLYIGNYFLGILNLFSPSSVKRWRPKLSNKNAWHFEGSVSWALRHTITSVNPRAQGHWPFKLRSGVTFSGRGSYNRGIVNISSTERCILNMWMEWKLGITIQHSRPIRIHRVQREIIIVILQHGTRFVATYVHMSGMCLTILLSLSCFIALYSVIHSLLYNL